MIRFSAFILFLIISTFGYSQVDRISDDSLKLLIDKGEKGDTSAQIFLAKAYYSGVRIIEDNKKSFYWFSKASELSCKESYYYLGVIYDEAYGVPKDYVKAKYYFEKAANLEDIFAMNYLGFYYANGLGVTKDYLKSKYWYEKAAYLGNDISMTNLGEFYEKGLGVIKDYKKAKYWYEKAANLENSDAINSLGNFYSKGFGVAKDCQEAKYWYDKGVKLRDANSMYNLGELYNMDISQGAYLVIQDNCDEIKDNKLAIEWHERSVQSGNINSLFKLGEINEAIGKYDKAKYWYDKAIENNNASAMVNLGRMYRFGNGVEQSYENAKELFEKAYKLGDKIAYSQIQFIEEINPDKINGISLVRRKSISKEYSYIDFSNGWIYLTSTENDIKLFKEVFKDGYDLKVWIKSIPKTNQLINYRSENASYFKSATVKQKLTTQLSSHKSLYILNCKGKNLGEKSSVYYTKNGNVIYSDSNDYFNSYDMSEVIPESIGEEILKTICEYYEKYGK